MSTIRRKPRWTYISPEPSSPWTLSQFIPSSASSSSSSSSSSGPGPSVSATSSATPEKRVTFKRHAALTLPLYHPLGPLALSQPPLDQTSYGFPPDMWIYDDYRPPAQLPLKELPSSIVFEPIADLKDKEAEAVPKKRRGGKRKRRDPDEADATYPAKKTRQTPARNNSHNANHVHESSPVMDSARRSVATPDAELVDDLDEEERPPKAKRTTRSRGLPSSPKAQTPPLTPRPATPLQDAVQRTPTPTLMLEQPQKEPVASNKEEGEISEDDKAAT